MFRMLRCVFLPPSAPREGPSEGPWVLSRVLVLDDLGRLVRWVGPVDHGDLGSLVDPHTAGEPPDGDQDDDADADDAERAQSATNKAEKGERHLL